MTRRVPLSERPDLWRDPADWARDWGWLSPTKAANRAAEIRRVAEVIDGALGDDEGAVMWRRALLRIADQIDPSRNAARYRKAKARKRLAAMREP